MNLGCPHVFIIVRVTLSLTSERDGNCICGTVHEVRELRNKPSVFCVELPFLHWNRLLLLRFFTRLYIQDNNAFCCKFTILLCPVRGTVAIVCNVGNFEPKV